MDCPQCGAEVPADNAFCGKCGYARRDDAPERLDQSRIRMHEEPEEPGAPEPAPRSTSQHRIRKRTVLGMPSAGAPPSKQTAGSTPPPPPPTSISSVRPGRTRVPQKTMLGIPRPDLVEPQSAESAEELADGEPSMRSIGQEGRPSEPAGRSHRVRARVRYDSANEPLSVTQRRRNALRGLAVLVLLAAAWIGYRLLTVNG
ncbi:MAG: zinc ribbon domain-containing protein [Polyangiales bacterium]